MSAIAGIINLDKKPVSTEHIEKIMKSFQQYLADDVGVWNKANIFFGCHAQWITPESVGEKLPFYDYERRLVIVADAIIDNRTYLFEQLQIDHNRRKTMPDSKLILLTYEKWGEKTPELLQGDFAFMIWDERKQRLFGARDFSGSRTLYFFKKQHCFAFSTTIESLFTLPYVERKLNEEWLAEFLVIPNIVEAVDMFSTVYQSIQQIPPSHSITIENGKVRFTRYCLIEVNETLKLKSNAEYEESFRGVLQNSVNSRLRTFGEVGSHLSGGLDSGAVVSFAAEELANENKKLHTFSSVPADGFVDWTPSYYVADETPYIKEVVKKVGNISANYCGFNGHCPLSEVDDFLDVMEMPYKFFDNTFWLKGINEIASSKGIKVLLNGARGNHSISWGSNTLTFDYYVQLLKSFQWLKLNKELDAYCSNFNTGKSVMLPFITKRAFIGREQEDNSFPVLIHPSLAKRTKVLDKMQEYGMNISGKPIKSLDAYRKEYYQHLYVWNKSGVVGTKLSLRYGLWDRDPTNDINVIRFCLSLPEEQYATEGKNRSIIRRSMKNRLPNKVRLNQLRRGLQGADVVNRMAPNWDGFLNELNELIDDSITDEIINKDTVRDGLEAIGNKPRSELIFDDNFKILTRSIIVYRFLKKF